ncbi:MAG: hypothetical protein ACHQ2Z_14045 [Elusimicrobiota bacterium]
METEAQAQGAVSPGRNLLVLFLAFLPLTAEWAYKVFVYPRPFWIKYYDPETIYFYGGLRFLRGELPPPHFVYDPGLPLHALSAAILLFTHRSPLSLPHFLIAAYATAWMLTLGAGFLLLRTVLSGLPAMLQIAALWTYFLFGPSLQRDNIWGPEILYFPAGALILACAWRLYLRPFSEKNLIRAGAAIGLACSLKFTVLAWAAAMPLAIGLFPPEGARRTRAAAILAGASAVGFLAATCVLIPRYSGMFEYLASISGGAVMPPVSQLLGSMILPVISAKGWHFWLLASFLSAAWGLRRGGRPPRPFAAAMTAFAVLAMTFSQLLAIEELVTPASTIDPHYLLSNALCGTLLFAMGSRLVFARKGPREQGLLLLFAALLLGRNMSADVRRHRRLITDGLAERAEIDGAIRRLSVPGKTPVVVYGWRAARSSYALRIIADPVNRAPISREFPDEGHISWNGHISLPEGRSRWDLLVATPEDLKGLLDPVGPVLASGVKGFSILSAPRPSPQ